MTRPETLARLVSMFLPWVVGACSSSHDTSAPRPAGGSVVLSGLPSSVTAGATANGTVTAQTASGSRATGYAGTVHFTSTDPAAQLPANHTFVAGDQGSYTFTVTFGTVGTQTVTATDLATSTITASQTIIVTPATKTRDVFAVGLGGTILHYDGTRWTSQMRDTRLFGLDGIWGSSGSDVFAVGSGGTILHYDGTSWTAQTSGTSSYLHGVWGSSGRDVFAVGDHGTILHYDGTTWITQTSGTTNYILQSLWGRSGRDVFAVGDSILHYDGTSWSPQRLSAVFAVWGSSERDVFAVGDYASILHYDGTSWVLQYACYSGSCPSELDGVWGSSASDVFAVGQGGYVLHYDGTSWTAQTNGLTAYLLAVWGSSPTK